MQGAACGAGVAGRKEHKPHIGPLHRRGQPLWAHRVDGAIAVLQEQAAILGPVSNEDYIAPLLPALAARGSPPRTPGPRVQGAPAGPVVG